MIFSERLKALMEELKISQGKLCDLTGIGASSVSQYLSGKHEPTAARKREIARALGVREEYFEAYTTPAVPVKSAYVNLPVELAAKLMTKSKEFVMQGLRDGVFPWGYAVKLAKWSYFISPVKFEEYTGISVPVNEVDA